MEAKTLLLAGAMLALTALGALSLAEGGTQHPAMTPAEEARTADTEACTLPEEPPPRDEGACAPSPPSPEPGVRFILTGDTGTGGEAQHRVAEQMQAVCETEGCDFVVVAGDNIYETGARSAHDPQFETKFEEPYADMEVPFFLTVGNHDSAGGPTAEAGGEEHHVPADDEGLGAWHASADHEVAYTYREDRTDELAWNGEDPSAKWTMPARWYTFTVDDDLAQFYSLDANALMWWGDALFVQDPLALQQEAWLTEQMEASDASWQLVFGHQPYISNGNHGNAGEYNDQHEHQEFGSNTLGVYLKGFIERNVCPSADLYLAGHDHDLQWLYPEEDECGPTTEFLVSGAGAKTRDLTDTERNPARFQQGDTYGFFHVELVEDEMTATVYDDTGAHLFEETVEKEH